MALALLAHTSAMAQSLADPTRPAGANDRSAAAPARSAAPTAPAAWPQLQSLQISAQGESSALVDGRVVRVGERIGEVTVVAIDAQGVLLRGARFEQRIALSPGVAKTASAALPTPSRTAMGLVTKETQ